MAIYSGVACLFFLILYVVSSYINTVSPLDSVIHLASFTSYVFVFFLSMRIAFRKRFIFLLLVIVSLVSSVLYVLHLLHLLSLPFLTHHDFQFILPTESGHNHLGDLVVLGLISSLFLNSSILLTLIQVLFLVIISFSFSKSALIGLVFVTFSLMFSKKRYGLFIGAALLASFLIGIYSQERIPLYPLGGVQQIVQKTLHINPKPLLSSREKYMRQILQPWTSTPLEHVFFGYGPGNFKYASNRTAESAWDIVSDTHNIVLTIFVESGFLPIFWFIVFVGMTIFTGYQNRNPLTYLILYLIAHFQMDYTYRIPFFMYLFFFLCGQVAHIPSRHFSLFSRKNILILLSLVIFVIFGIISFRSSQQYKALNIQLNQGIQTQNREMFMSAAKRMEEMTPYESDLLLTLASFHESFGTINESIRLLDKLYLYAPREYFARLPHIMELQKKLKMPTRAYLLEKEKEFKTFPFTPKEKSYLDHTCREYLERECL